MPTQFMDYGSNYKGGLHLMHLRKRERTKALDELWGIVEKNKQNKTQVDAHPTCEAVMSAGELIVFNSAHIHWQPPPPTEGFRRVVFMSFGSSGERNPNAAPVLQNNWRNKWKDFI